MQGTRVGPYQIVKKLGSGGHGDVWLGRRTASLGFQQDFALKILKPQRGADYDAAWRVLADEAKALSRASHPAIVKCVDFQALEGSEGRLLDTLVMEYAAGVDLQQLLRHTGALSSVETLFLMDGLLSALEHMHDHGQAAQKGPMLHRDLKPGNIVVTTAPAIKILDFGLAMHIERLSVGTPRGTTRGTPRYMPPERLRGVPATRASDLYACGAVLFEALTGTPYVQGDSLEQLLPRIVRTRPTERLPALAMRLEMTGESPASVQAWTRLAAALLDPDPARRPQRVADLYPLLDPLHEGVSWWTARARLRARFRGPAQGAAVSPNDPTIVGDSSD